MGNFSIVLCLGWRVNISVSYYNVLVDSIHIFQRNNISCLTLIFGQMYRRIHQNSQKELFRSIPRWMECKNYSCKKLIRLSLDPINFEKRKSSVAILHSLPVRVICQLARNSGCWISCSSDFVSLLAKPLLNHIP